MKRKILLIGNPGMQGINYSPSVFPVLKRYKEFFKSEVGGFWYDSEIIEEPKGYDNNSEVTWLACQLRELNSEIDYSIIIFVGHGGSYLGEDKVQLSKGEVLPLSCLLPPQGFENRVKRTIIVDACRSLIGGTREQLLLESRSFSGEGKLMGNYCRDYYEHIIEECQPHTELLQSTKYGEYARINPNHTGTAFSDALFNTLDKNVPTWNQNATSERCGQLHKGIADILPSVQAGMSGYNQIPEYSRLGGNGDFPLYAVWRAVERRL